MTALLWLAKGRHDASGHVAKVVANGSDVGNGPREFGNDLSAPVDPVQRRADQ